MQTRRGVDTVKKNTLHVHLSQVKFGVCGYPKRAPSAGGGRNMFRLRKKLVDVPRITNHANLAAGLFDKDNSNGRIPSAHKPYRPTPQQLSNELCILRRRPQQLRIAVRANIIRACIISQKTFPPVVPKLANVPVEKNAPALQCGPGVGKETRSGSKLTRLAGTPSYPGACPHSSRRAAAGEVGGRPTPSITSTM